MAIIFFTVVLSLLAQVRPDNVKVPAHYRPICYGELPSFIFTTPVDRVYESLTDLCAGPTTPHLNCGCYGEGPEDGILACGTNTDVEPVKANRILEVCERQCSCSQPEVTEATHYDMFKHREDRSKSRSQSRVPILNHWIQVLRDGIYEIRNAQYFGSIQEEEESPQKVCSLTEPKPCRSTRDCQPFCKGSVCVLQKAPRSFRFIGQCIARPLREVSIVESTAGRKRSTMFDPSGSFPDCQPDSVDCFQS